MKKILFSIFAAVMVIGFVGCEYDDSELVGRVDNLEQRVLTLEQLCQQMNTNISSLQSLVSALQNQDYITSVTPIKQGNDVIGYTITFAKGEPITIYHGQDGKNGADGEDGKDGYTPVIGVDKDEDGVYYWTLDGEWLTDAEGNKIPTSGKDGADGEDGEGGKAGMPELRIQGGYWYVSYDGGENWERLGRATGYDGTDGKDGVDGDAFFDNVDHKSNPDFVIFTLSANGGEFYVPKYKEFSVELETPSASYVKVGDSNNVTINYTVVGCDNPSVVVISNLSTKVDKSAKKITVKAPTSKDGLDDVETVTLMVSNGSTTIMASVEITVADAVILATNQSDLTTAVNNIKNQDTAETVVVNIGSGNIDIPSDLFSFDENKPSKTIIIEGAGENSTKLKGALNSNANQPGNYAHNAELYFKNLTFETVNNGYNGGFGHAKSVTFENCTIKGQFYAHSWAPHTFIDCTIEQTTGYLYTYSSNCDFTGCKFVSPQGKALQIYSEDNNGEFTINIINCTFTASTTAQTWDGKPVTAIDINSIKGNKFYVNIENTTATGYATGLYSGSSLWNIKNNESVDNKVTVVINGSVVD